MEDARRERSWAGTSGRFRQRGARTTVWKLKSKEDLTFISHTRELAGIPPYALFPPRIPAPHAFTGRGFVEHSSALYLGAPHGPQAWTHSWLWGGPSLCLLTPFSHLSAPAHVSWVRREMKGHPKCPVHLTRTVLRWSFLRIAPPGHMPNFGRKKLKWYYFWIGFSLHIYVCACVCVGSKSF